MALLVACSGKTSSNAAATAALFPKETGADGCTVYGLSTQVKAGYTGITTSSQSVNYRLSGQTYYAVLQIAGAQIGTNVVLNRDLKPNIYNSSSCPLDLDAAPLTKEGTEYTRTVADTTTISFLKSGSYLLYLYQQPDPNTTPTTVLTTGTPVQAISGDSLTDILNGGSTTTFKFACDGVATGVCQNYYGSFSSCLFGGTKQSGKCTEDGTVVGSCKIAQSGVGTIVSVYRPSLDLSSAQALCTSPGVFQAGTTVQTP